MNQRNKAPVKEDPAEDSSVQIYMRLVSGFLRTLSGAWGMTLLWLLVDDIFIQHNGIPGGSGYYGPVMFPVQLYAIAVFLAYAIGGQKWLRRILFRYLPKNSTDDKDANS